MISIAWIRRELRLHDHAVLHTALKGEGAIQLVFIFDTDILARFSDKKDKRLSLLAKRLCVLDDQLKKHGGGMLVLHGRPQELMPKLASALDAKQLVAAEDFEPATRKRDAEVKAALPSTCRMVQPLDHLLQAPYSILKDDETPYKVFTPYSKRWRAAANGYTYEEKTVADKGRYADIEAVRKSCHGAHISTLNPADGPEAMLKAIGYEPAELGEWLVEDDAIHEQLAQFAKQMLRGYQDSRNMLAEEGTSKLSPYLRFGFISVRECARLAVHQESEGSYTWLNELIWRDFYAMILHHFPEVVEHEFQEKYRGGVLDWSSNERHIEAFKEGKTGYPVVDAAMRQLNETGWMHNRARMIVASFATKHLGLDWRIGEEYFAQKLMDYDLASNNGGWQWAASTGTDAQPYFRVFNPTTQGERFDPKGEYIRKYVPELADVEDKYIHEPHKAGLFAQVDYPEPIVEHKAARAAAIERFKA